MRIFELQKNNMISIAFEHKSIDTWYFYTSDKGKDKNIFDYCVDILNKFDIKKSKKEDNIFNDYEMSFLVKFFKLHGYLLTIRDMELEKNLEMLNENIENLHGEDSRISIENLSYYDQSSLMEILANKL